MANSFDMDLFWVDPKSVCERGENADFVQSVVAVDIQRRFSLGIALGLRVLQNCMEVGAFEFHPGQDVITGAVDDAVKVGDAIADEAFPQGFDYRDAATNAGF